MSAKDVSRFLQRLAEDGVFQGKLDNYVAARADQRGLAASELVSFAAAHGYDFSVQELRQGTSPSPVKRIPLQDLEESGSDGTSGYVGQQAR